MSTTGSPVRPPFPRESPMSVTAPRRLVVAACLLACVLAPETASASNGHDATESAIVHAINRFRAQHGLPSLVTNRALHRAAVAHSTAMMRRNVLAHGAFGSRVRHYLRARSTG